MELQKKIILICPWLRYVEKAKKAGLYVVVIWTPSTTKKGKENLEKIKKIANEIYIIQNICFSDLKTCIDTNINIEKIDFIYHIGNENSMYESYKISEYYDKALNSSESISLINNKIDMRSSITNVEYMFFNNYYELIEKIDYINFFPIILKPSNLSGSNKIYNFKNKRDLSNNLISLKKDFKDSSIIIEEFLNGPEVSVETLTINGQHYFLGITDKYKFKDTFVEKQHVFPSRLSKKVIDQIETVTSGFLDKVKYKFGPCHTEVIITENGPKIVESQARFAGDNIPKLIENVTNLDFEFLLFEFLNSSYTKSFPVFNRNKVSTIYYLNISNPYKQNISNGLYNEILKIPYVKSFEMTSADLYNLPKITNSKTRHGYIIFNSRKDEDIIESINSCKKTFNKYGFNIE